MALTLSTAARNAAANAVVDLVDGGTGAGKLVIMTSGDVEVATLTFSDPAFGAASSGTATASAITSDTSATGGTAALFKVTDSDDVEIWRGTVGTSGADLNLNTVTIPAASTVAVSSLTYTQPAS